MLRVLRYSPQGQGRHVRFFDFRILLIRFCQKSYVWHQNSELKVFGFFLRIKARIPDSMSLMNAVFWMVLLEGPAQHVPAVTTEETA